MDMGSYLGATSGTILNHKRDAYVHCQVSLHSASIDSSSCHCSFQFLFHPAHSAFCIRERNVCSFWGRSYEQRTYRLGIKRRKAPTNSNPYYANKTQKGERRKAPYLNFKGLGCQVAPHQDAECLETLKPTKPNPATFGSQNGA